MVAHHRCHCLQKHKEFLCGVLGLEGEGLVVLEELVSEEGLEVMIYLMD